MNLIAGANGTGKSSLASSIATKIACHQIRTTDVREAIRTVVPRDAFGELFVSTFRLDTLESGESASLIGLFEKQSHPVLRAVAAILNMRLFDDATILVEGIHHLPAIMNYLPSDIGVVFLMRQPRDEQSHWMRLVERARKNARKPISKYEGAFPNIRAIGNLIEAAWLSSSYRSRVRSLGNVEDPVVEALAYLRTMRAMS